jgi:DNA repair protein RadC
MPRKTPLPQWCRIVRERPAEYERIVWGTLGAVRRPADVVTLVTATLEREEVEVFIVALLDVQHRVIALQELTRGTVNSSLVHPREVFRLAIALGAAAIIVAHNHPSGDPRPSADDRTVMEQLVAAGRLLDIPVHDSVIIGTPGRYFSFAEAGLL